MPFSANDVKLMLLNLFRHVQRLQTRKEIGKVLGLCTFLNKIRKQEFDVISGKWHISDLLKGCIEANLKTL